VYGSLYGAIQWYGVQKGEWMSGVKSIHEYTQDNCSHKLEELDPEKEGGFRYRCVVCGKYMKALNGVIVARPQPRSRKR